MVYLALGCMLVLFVWGIIFILRGYRTTIEEEKAVPISDLKEIQDIKGSYPLKNEPAVVSNPVAQHLLQENLRKLLPQDFSSIKLSRNSSELEVKVADLQARVLQLSTENNRLNDALKRELDSKEISRLSDQEQNELKVREEQLNKSRQSHEQLTQDHLHLRKLLADEKTKVSEMEHQIVNLQKDKDILSAEVKNVEQLTAERANLLVQFRHGQAKSSELEGRLKKSEQEHEHKLKELAAEYEALKSRQSESAKAGQSQLAAALKDVNETMESLAHKKKDLEGRHGQLQAEIETLKKFNTHLIEKEKFLQYELTKSRAQAIGLERLCEDFKGQIERLSSMGSGNQKG